MEFAFDARTEELRAQVSAFLDEHVYPAEPVFWDLLPDNSEALRLARALGFTPLRRLVRMVLGEPPRAGRREWVYAGAGFEYG